MRACQGRTVQTEHDACEPELTWCARRNDFIRRTGRPRAVYVPVLRGTSERSAFCLGQVIACGAAGQVAEKSAGQAGARVNSVTSLERTQEPRLVVKSGS